MKGEESFCMPCQLKHWLALTMLSVAGCGQPSQYGRVEAPFTAEVGGFKLSVPKSLAYSQADLTPREGAFPIVSFDLCPRSSVDASLPEGCSAFGDLPMTDRGIRVFLSGLHVATGNLVYFRAQSHVPPPPGQPLIPLSVEAGGVRITNVTDVENALIDRLRHPWPAVPATTAQRWPTVACGVFRSGTQLSCAGGFLIGDMYVEAHWTDKPNVKVSQKYVWDVATKITARVRALIR